MTCGGCGRANRSGARFCLHCGAPLGTTCPSCDAELPPGARFCDGCGEAVEASVVAGAPAAAAPTSAAGQTRKVVTVLFADLAGSTSFQETLDPESVRRMMDRFNQVLRAAVDAHAGTFVKFTGDGLMAAFGVPIVAEDDAWRAVQTAAAMQAAFRDLGWGGDVSLRVGINTGEVIVAQWDADVVGDVVNVAARLETAAGDGGVLVGEETWRLTRHLADFQPQAPLVVRGRAEPVVAYRLIGLPPAGGDGGDEARAGSVAPVGAFVGRRAELAQLSAVFEEAARERAVRLAAVVGSPGLGKSRLAAELVSTLAARATVLEARFSSTATSTFGPVVDALRAAVDADGLGDLVAASPEEAFLAVRRSLEGLGSERPVVLVLEDLHWAEPLVLDLVEHLVEWTQGAALFILALARPELRQARPALVDTATHARMVSVLTGLDPASTERLACDLLDTDELPAPLVARILTASEGNPLFVRELVRMLVEDGVLRREGVGWKPTVDVEAINVPPSIQSLLAVRVERLLDDERAALESASVVGREFSRGAVAELLPPGQRDGLGPALERLRQKEMVEPAGGYWIDEPVFRFHHVLLRDAAYRRLLKEVRADRHERLARWLAPQAGAVADHDEVLGYHLEQAHRYRVELGLFDDHTVAVGHEAAARLSSAGRRALDRDDLPAAATLLRRALGRLSGDDPERPALLIDLCEALIATGQLADGALAVAELRQLAGGSARLGAWADCFEGQLATVTAPERLPETADAVERAAGLLAKLGDAAGAAKGHDVHAAALSRLGRVADCELALDRALAAAREAGDGRRATAVLAGTPLAALWGPSTVARASGRCLDVVRVLRITSGATTVEATSLRCQAVLEALRGRTDAARRMLAGARKSLEELGHRHGLLSTEMFAGLVELLADAPAAAETLLRAAHAGFRDLGVDADAGQAAALLARAVLAQGRADEAEALTVDSERLGGADLKTAIAWRAVRAEAMARRGDIDGALELAQAAVAVAAPTDALVDQADTHLAMATVLALAQRTADSEAEAAQAAELYERKGATVLARRAQALLGHAVSHASRGRPAARLRRVRPNAATRAMERYEAAVAQGDVDAAMEAHAEGYLLRDHVHHVERSHRWDDLDPQTLRVGSASFESIASLGDRHLLCRTRMSLNVDATGPSEFEDLRVVRVDDLERFVWAERYHVDDLHLALARLLELYAEDEVAEPLRPRLMSEARIARTTEDAARAHERYAERAVLVDHRPGGVGTVHGREAVLAVGRPLIEVARDGRLRIIDVLGLSVGAQHVALLETAVEGHSRDGGAFALHMLALTEHDDDGLHERLEWFSLDQTNDALARFDELAAVDAGARPSTATSTAVPRNRAAEVAWQIADGVAARDWEAVTALHATTAVTEDRRSGLRAVITGLDETDALMRAMTAVGRVDTTLLATRGDRLTLVRLVLSGDDPEFEAEVLVMIELDESGHVHHTIVFEADDLDIAFAELDAAFRTGEAAQFASAVSVGDAFAAAFAAADWDRFHELLAPDIRTVEHRQVGWEARDRDSYVASTRALREMADKFVARNLAVPRVSAAGGVTLWEFRGTYGDAGQFERGFATVLLVRDGLVQVLELFATEELDAAIARFDELTALEARAPQTLAERTAKESIEGFVAQDWEGLGPIAEGAVVDDRRRGLGSTIELEHLDANLNGFLAGTDFSHVEWTTVATRGELLVLVEIRWTASNSDGGPMEGEVIQLHEVNDEGQCVAIVQFDPADIEAALEELDARYRAGEGAPKDGR